MTWQEKLKWFIQGTLNIHTIGPYAYEVFVIDDHNLEICHPDEPILTHWNKRELPSCWKEVGRDLIHKIIDRRIADVIKRIDNQ